MEPETKNYLPTKLKRQMLLQLAFGVVGTVIFVIFILYKTHLYSSYPIGMRVLFSCLFFLATIMLLYCARSLNMVLLLPFYKKVRSKLQHTGSVSIRDLCSESGNSVGVVSGRIYKLIWFGLLPQNCMDIENEQVRLTKENLPNSKAEGTSTTVLSVMKSKLTTPIYWIGAVWLAYSMAFPMLQIYDFLTVAIISAAVYFIAAKALPPRKILVEQKRLDAFGAEDRPTKEFLLTATNYLEQLGVLRQAIQAPKMKVEAAKILETAIEIFDFAKAHPNKMHSLNQFMDYYLPLTIKLLGEYREMELIEEKGDNVVKSIASIEECMDTVVQAFRQELDGLYSDRALDISTDIAVLKKMVKLDEMDDMFKKV